MYSGLYILAMIAVGVHLSHAIQSVLQTFGLTDDERLPIFGKLSVVLGIAIALAYISIPVYIFVAL